MTAAQRRKRHRRDARKTQSTRSITPEGKIASRANSLKHGLTAQVLTLAGEVPEVIQAKAQRWHEKYQPQGPVEETLVDQIALNALRLERVAKAENAVTDEQVRDSEIQLDRDQKLRLLQNRRLLRRDRATAIIHLQSFGAGVAWLLSRWKLLEAAFNASHCFSNLGLLREAILLRALDDDAVGGGYEFAHLAVSCVEGHENIPGLVAFLENYNDESAPCIDGWKNMKEFLTSMSSYLPDASLSRAGVRTLSVAEARRTMRSWIDRQLAELRELDRHFREADALSRAAAKVRAEVPAETPQNRLLLRYMKSAELAFDRSVKTLEKLQRDRRKQAETDDDEVPPEPQKTDLRNEVTVTARPHSKELVPGSCVTMNGEEYVVVEKSDGNVILAPVAPLVEEKPEGVASGSENGV